MEGQSPEDCIQNITITGSSAITFVENGTVCFQCGSGSGVVTNSTFMISNADIDPSMGAVVNGILVILDSTEIFDPRDVVDVTCFNGSNIVTAIAFLIGELLIIMRG